MNLVKRAWQYEVTLYEGITTEVVADGRASGLPIIGTGLYGQGGWIDPASKGLPASMNFATLPFYPGGPAGAGTWGASTEDGATFDPTDGMAQPGKTGSQRLNQSHRPSKKQKCLDEARKEMEKELQRCWEEFTHTKRGPWDPDELFECLIAYSKNKLDYYKCLYNQIIDKTNYDKATKDQLKACMVQAVADCSSARKECK